MKIGSRLAWIVIGAAAAITLPIGLAAICLLVIITEKPTYDINHPNYKHYAKYFDRLGTELSGRDLTRQDEIDFSTLNGGAWKRACVFGGYTNPLREIQTTTATITDADLARFESAKRILFRLALVEESEIMIAYIDLDNRAHFIHFRSGIGPEGQYLERCAFKPNNTVALGF